MMSLSSLSRIRSQLIFALLVAIGLLCIPLIRNFAKQNPWAAFDSDNYLDPFGPNVGSVMTNVDVTAWVKNNRVASFNVGKVQLRRDQQFLRLANLNNGVLYTNGKPTAKFSAKLANYDVKRGYAEVSGPATFSNQDFTLSTLNLSIDRQREVVKSANVISGSYRGGSLSANSFSFDYGNRHAVLKDVRWSGPIEVFTQEKGQKRKIDIRCREMETSTNPDREVYADAELHETDSIIRAEHMEWDKEKDIVTAEGNVEYYGADAVMVAPKVVIYRKEKRAVATGAIHVLVKPEKDKGDAETAPTIPPAQPKLPSGLKQPIQAETSTDQELRDPKTGRRYPITVTCTKVEYFYAKGSKRAVITGSPVARQELRPGVWREVTAPIAIYEEEKELLTLKSNEGGHDVSLKNSNGDSFLAESIVISTIQGQEKMRAFHLEGKMMVKDEDDGGGGNPPPKGARED